MNSEYVSRLEYDRLEISSREFPPPSSWVDLSQRENVQPTNQELRGPGPMLFINVIKEYFTDRGIER